MRMRHLAVVACAVSASNCAITGPSCIAQQQRGTAAMVDGEVAAGAVVSHVVPYDTQGSQNTVRIRWTDQDTPSGPRIQVYATRSSCASFQPPPSPNSSECALLGQAGWTPSGIVDTLVVTHGRGNPETLGPRPEYMLWIAGDPERNARYTITSTWFFGPDC
jgi:hypothetical protein